MDTPIQIETEITRRVIVAGKWILIEFPRKEMTMRHNKYCTRRTIGTTRAERHN